MQKKSTKRTLIALSALLLIGFAALVVHNYKTKTSLKYANQTAEELKPDENKQDEVSAAVNKEGVEGQAQINTNLLKIGADDFALGDKNAPVVFVEYASLSCPHCASFAREAFEKIKTEYIDSGKVLFVFRNFPLNQAALNGAMFATCQAQDEKENSTEKYYATIKALFKTQDAWAFDEKSLEKLEAIAKLDGMSSQRFKSCIGNKNLQEKILNARMEAAKNLQIQSVPSFFVNGEVSSGYVDYKSLSALLEKKLSEAEK